MIELKCVLSPPTRPIFSFFFSFFNHWASRNGIFLVFDLCECLFRGKSMCKIHPQRQSLKTRDLQVPNVGTHKHVRQRMCLRLRESRGVLAFSLDAGFQEGVGSLLIGLSSQRLELLLIQLHLSVFICGGGDGSRGGLLCSFWLTSSLGGCLCWSWVIIASAF